MITRACLIGSALICVAGAAQAAAGADTRGYVISWFATATYKDFKENCPEDRNGGQLKLNVRQLRGLGYSEQQATEIVANSGAQLLPKDSRRVGMNAKVNGQNVSIYNYPEATEDPNIETVTGKYAYGFDLGGKNLKTKFVDPETGEKVDNQLWRAVGCTDSFHASLPGKPYPEELAWNLMIDTAPAWTMQISGEDLSSDGKVTVTLDRATQHLERDATGEVLTGATYIIDPSPRSHNVLQGEIKNGVLAITPADIYLEAEHPFYFDIGLRNAHMRYRAVPSGKLVGYWGGYLNWLDFIYMYTSRPGNGADSVGLYHAIKKMADSDPDPQTGQNRYISATFRMEALPAFLAARNGQIVAVPNADIGALKAAGEGSNSGAPRIATN